MPDNEVAVMPPVGQPVNNPMALLHAAIEKGVDVAALEKLMDLNERWERNVAEKAFNTAFSAAQAEMPRVVADGVNKGVGSKYARYETVVETCMPILTKHGLGVIFAEDLQTPAKPGHVRGYMEIVHEAGHSKRWYGEVPKDGVDHDGKPLMTKSNNELMKPIWSYGSTRSYLKRYIFMDGFNISKENQDTDGAGPAMMTGTITTDEAALVNAHLARFSAERREGFNKWAKVALGTDVVADMPRSMLSKALWALSGLQKPEVTK